MSLIKANAVQVGQSPTATQNFTLAVPSSPDGTIKLARGNSGATTQDVLSVDASGNINGLVKATGSTTARSLVNRFADVVNVKDFGADPTGVVDSRQAIQDAITYGTLNNKSIYLPGGTYLINGVAGSDSYLNGILVPFNTVNTNPALGIEIFGDAGATVIKANSNNMITLRISRNYVTIRDIVIEGNNKTGCVGIGIVPESTTQTTTLVSQSYVTIERCGIQNCVEGLWIKPGPTVTGSDSGCFYHYISGTRFYNNVRHIWSNGAAGTSNNRITRSIFIHCNIFKGTNGIHIEKGTELDFISCNFESLTGTAFNYSDTNPANIRIIGGYAEACATNIISINPQQIQLVGFTHTGTTDPSESFMGRQITSIINVAKLNNTPAYISAGGESFAGFIIDPDSSGQKTLVVQTNGTERMRFFNGLTTFKGSNAEIRIGISGASIDFQGTSTNYITNPSGAEQANRADRQFWQTATGVNIIRFDLTGTPSFFPSTDNALLLGQSGLRWSQVWAANGTIQTSDPRTKKDIVDSPLGLDFINALRPVAYKFKVGGNKIVGEKIIKPAILNEDGNVIEEAIVEPIIESIPGKRQHFGFITTDVLNAANNVDFGGFIKTELNNPDSEEALRYDEFIAPIVKAIQEQQKQIEELSAKVIALESK